MPDDEKKEVNQGMQSSNLPPGAQSPYAPPSGYAAPGQSSYGPPSFSPGQSSQYGATLMDGIDPRWPIKSKVAAGVLGILLGGLGIHKFYLGKTGKGILYLVFCWTFIPEIVGIVEGILYLTSSDYNFQVKNHVRIG